ncbi:50S ribosomal protein L25 [Brevibacillus centrosporus]|uniref:Large ribosomal subunit protein bL25 n=1 Tax=Brevibacillus centrosporus TaxID=54910 RepID=A0A1I4BTR9_9BACL|nr:50S ribosomal protein L25 [Brevibacillus centrosporus]MEC2132728.1 50S ribosomal protein L25 [Brevibacillus centrosporus]MED4908331.1 50S ribosomal protein L25 [Brevibacillus centrosporus]RNB66530.1 50S ribosomal protein L25 [Brevibacillus centrosporus]SFK72065.1 LSU ribosomal protein L25P [Brevibacillus centrosporus]GED33463.1 50S ribosomal protein L25 [Brevibacillus centrosporus]
MEAIQGQSRAQGMGNSVKKLRRNGWVPGIVYGSDITNQQIQVQGKELDAALRRQATNKPYKLMVDGSSYDVMVYELQRHPVMGNILHADFKKINMNEKVHTTVPVLMTGDPELGVATLVRHSVEISCLPGNIPESFTVDVDGLNIGDVVLVSDLVIPAGVELGLDAAEVLISVLPVKAKSEESIEAQHDAEQVAEAAGSTEQSNRV